MTVPETIDLHAGDLFVQVCPDVGGAVLSFRRRTERGMVPILRDPMPDALSGRDARGMACYPLLPYSNRIADGRFAWQGETHQLDHNFGRHPHTIHGVGWQQRWRGTGTGVAATLRLSYDPEDSGLFTWPFALQASLRYLLDPQGLTVAMAVENTDHRAWPAGLGLHPYFPRDPGLRIGFEAGDVWTVDANSLPIAPGAPPGPWRFDPARTIAPPPLDNCFEGWNGTATLSDDAAGHRVTLTADDKFRHLIVYTPDGKPYCAVEPATHLPDAVNREGDHGLRVLRPGEKLEGTVRFQIDPA